jgi:hypothetical protein
VYEETIIGNSFTNGKKERILRKKNSWQLQSKNLKNKAALSGFTL